MLLDFLTCFFLTLSLYGGGRMRWGGGVGDTASMDRSKLLLSDDLLLELETKVHKVFTVPGEAPTPY